MGALAEAEECIRLVESGAGDASYSPALQTAALLHAAAGDTTGAARCVLIAIDHDARTGRRLYVPVDIAIAAVVLAVSPDGLVPAAVLAGAVSGPVFGHINLYIRGSQRDRYDRVIKDVSHGLGPDTDTRSQQQGAAMTYDEIISYTVDQLDRLADL